MRLSEFWGVKYPREGIHRNVNLFTLLVFTKKNCNMVAISYDNC